MPDRVFTEPRLARVYDAFCAWSGRPEQDFYLERVMAASRVLDIGCGTGELLRIARQRGHKGYLCGVDPSAAMLDVARTQSGIDWVLGDVHALSREFDLVVMTGNVFQIFLDDTELEDVLLGVRARLATDGRFVFETREPAAREWEAWSDTVEAGNVRMVRHVTKVEGERVSFTLTFTSPDWDAPEVSESTLRFHDVDSLNALLRDAGLDVVEQLVDAGEIVTVARQRPPR